MKNFLSNSINNWLSSEVMNIDIFQPFSQKNTKNGHHRGYSNYHISINFPSIGTPLRFCGQNFHTLSFVLFSIFFGNPLLDRHFLAFRDPELQYTQFFSLI